MKHLKILYKLLVYLTNSNVLLFWSYLNKKALKTTSSLVIFRAFSFAPDPKSEKNPVNKPLKSSGLSILYVNMHAFIAQYLSA